MKRFFILLLVYTGLSLTFAQGAPTENVKEVLSIKVSENKITSGLMFISGIDIYKGMLYVPNGKKMVQIDLKTGEVSMNRVMSDFLAKSKDYMYKMRVLDSASTYVSFLNEIFLITADGKISKCFGISCEIYDFQVEGHCLLVPTLTKGILLYDLKQKKCIDQFSYHFSSTNYVPNPYGIICSDWIGTYEFMRVGTKIRMNKYPPIEDVIKSIQEPQMAYATGQYRICFPYKDRSKIYVIKQDTKTCEIVRTLSLNGKNYTPDPRRMTLEEGDPNFKVLCRDGVCYAVILNKGILTVLSFNL